MAGSQITKLTHTKLDNTVLFFNPSWTVIHFHNHHGMHIKEMHIKKNLTNITSSPVTDITRNTQCDRPHISVSPYRDLRTNPHGHNIRSQSVITIAFQQWHITSNKNCLTHEETMIHNGRNYPMSINNSTQGPRQPVGPTISPRAAQPIRSTTRPCPSLSHPGTLAARSGSFPRTSPGMPCSLRPKSLITLHPHFCLFWTPECVPQPSLRTF